MSILVAGTVAIIHYARTGQNLADSPDLPTVTVSRTVQATTTSAAPAQPSAPAQAAVVTPTTSTSASPSRSPSASPSTSHPQPSQSAMTTPPTPPRNHTPLSAPIHFRTLPPGAVLPTGAECARWVLKNPQRENKRANKPFNHATGQRVGSHFFPVGDSPRASHQLARRINGHFTGTTKEILRWAACKWGINQNIVFAQAAVESWWHQDTLGDWGTDPKACPPGHKLGADGKRGQCPQSYGILQNRYPFEKSSWPGIGRSTAMNADTAYAIWRSCFDGYEIWLNNVPHHGTYHRGDLWGCVGRWFAGRWHTPPAQHYLARVRTYLRERIWQTKNFQQG